MFKMPFKLSICLFLAFAYMEMEMEQSSAEMERIQVSMEAPRSVVWRETVNPLGAESISIGMLLYGYID